MSAKSIVILILLSGFVCFGMPESLCAQYGTGIAQDDEAEGRNLVRNLEDALQSGDQEKIRRAQHRVNAHQHAARLLAQRPVLKLQVKMAMTPAPAAALKAQAVQSQDRQKQQLTAQTRTLERSGGLSSASGLQGAAVKEASPLASSKIQGTSGEGMTVRTGGFSSAGVSGTGLSQIRSFSAKPEGVSSKSVTGVSSVGTLGTASEVGRGVRSPEQTAGVGGDIGKGVGTAVAVGSGVASPGALGSTAEIAATAKAAPAEPPAPARRIAAKPVAVPAAVPSPPIPIAPVKPPPPAPAPASAGYTFSPAAQPKVPAEVMIEARTGSVEAVKSMASPEGPDLGPSGTGLQELPKPNAGANTRIGPPDPEPHGPSIQDILKQMASKEPPPKTEPFGIKMPEGKTVQTSADAGNPVDPNSPWTDVMKAGKGETRVEPTKIVRGDPNQAKLAGPTEAQLGDQKMNYVSRGDPSLTTARSRTGYSERVDAYEEISAKGERQIGRMQKALKSGETYGLNADEVAVNIKEAALDIRTNPRAVQLAKQLPPKDRQPFQDAIQNQETIMKEGIKNRTARLHNIDPLDPKNVDRVKVQLLGKSEMPADGDVEVLIDGKQVKAKVIKPIVDQEAMRAADADKWLSASKKPEKFAEDYNIETQDTEHRHALGRSSKEARLIVKGDKRIPWEDPSGVYKTLADKSHVEFQKGDKSSLEWNQPKAEAQYGEGYRQLAKDYQGIIEPKVTGYKAQVPSQVQKGMEIVNKVGQKVDGRVFTPADADEALRQMGETRATITDKATGLVEEVQTLRPPGQKRVSDKVATETISKRVTDELDLRKMRRGEGSSGSGAAAGVEELPGPSDTGRFKPVTDAESLTEGKSSFRKPGLVEEAGDTVRSGIKAVQSADQQLANTLGVGELAKDASQFRKTANFAGAAVGTGMMALSVADMKTKEYEGDRDISTAKGLRSQAQIAREKGHGDIADGLDRAAESLEKSGFEKKKEAAIDGAQLLSGMAVGAVAPTASTVVGGAVIGYAGGRYLMENTETGRWLENQKEDLYDGRVAEGAYQARLAVGDQVGGYLGDETEAQRKQREYQKRQETYLNALQDGRLKLQEGASAKDVVDYIRYNDPTQPDYREGLNRLVARAPAAPPAGQGQTATADPAAAADKKSEAPPTGSSDEAVSRALNQMIEEKPTAMEQYAGIDRDVKPVLPEGDTGIGADLIGKLRDAEGSTSAGLPIGGAGMGADTGLQLALGANVTGSVLQDRDQQLRQEAQQAWGSIAGAQNERAVAEQNRQASDNTRVQAQGQQANQAIAANAQEFSTAQQTLQVTRQNSLVNVLVEAGMGGITSGTAVGINTFGTIVSSAMAQQISVNWGIAQPTPTVIPGTPSTAGTGSTGSQAGGGQTGSTSQASTSSTAASTTSPTVSTGSQTSGGQAVSPPQSQTRTASTSSGGTATTSRPPATSTSTGGTKSCRVAGTCYYTGYADKNGCCTKCGKKVAKK